MVRKVFTSEQIIRKLQEAEVIIAEGMTAQQAARQAGVPEVILTLDAAWRLTQELAQRIGARQYNYYVTRDIHEHLP